MARDAILDMVVKNGLSEEVTIKHKIERNEKESHGYSWGKSVPGRMNSKCKGPGAGMGSTSCKKKKNSKVPRVAEEWGPGKSGGEAPGAGLELGCPETPWWFCGSLSCFSDKAENLGGQWSRAVTTPD